MSARIKVKMKLFSQKRIETVAEFSRQVMDLLATEATWVKSSLACTRSGKDTSPSHDDAAKWCLLGAVSRTKHDPTGYEVGPSGVIYRNACAAEDYQDILCSFIKAGRIGEFNDAPETTFAMVRRLLIRADKLIHKTLKLKTKQCRSTKKC